MALGAFHPNLRLHSIGHALVWRCIWGQNGCFHLPVDPNNGGKNPCLTSAAGESDAPRARTGEFRAPGFAGARSPLFGSGVRAPHPVTARADIQPLKTKEKKTPLIFV